MLQRSFLAPLTKLRTLSSPLLLHGFKPTAEPASPSFPPSSTSTLTDASAVSDQISAVRLHTLFVPKYDIPKLLSSYQQLNYTILTSFLSNIPCTIAAKAQVTDFAA